MSKKKNRNSEEKKSVNQAPEAMPNSRQGVTSLNGPNSMTNWLILLVILIPVLYSEKTIDPNLSIRYIFSSVILVSIAFYFYIIRKTPLFIPPSILIKAVFALGVAFAGWSIVSMFSAINYREGYYEVGRHLMNLILLFFVMTAISKEEIQIVKLCKALVIVSLFQSFVGIFQYYGLAFTELPGANEKPYGLMSNRNLFGSAQAFILPFVIFLFYKTGKVWKWISAAAFVLIISSLILSQTRSAWVAAASILIVSLLLVLIFSPVNRRRWIIGFTWAILCITGIVFIILATDTEGSLKRSVSERTKSFTLSKQQKNESTENAQERFKIWNKTISLIKDKPITGAGPGNWKINIPAYGTEGINWSYGKYAPDRPHNVYLQVTSETGIPGALFYFGMWLLIVIIALKIIYKPQTEDQRILIILVLSGLTAFACDSMFSFPTERIEHTLYIMLMGGIILGSCKNISNTGNNVKKMTNKALLFLIFAILIFNLFIGYKKYNYEIHLNRAKAFENNNNFQEMLAETEQGKSDFITMGPETGIIMQLKSSIALKELKDYDNALKEINIAKNYNPYSANTWTTMGTIYTDLKQYDKAVNCYAKALKLTPNNDIILKNLAVNYFVLADYAGCIETLAKINIKEDAYLTGMLNEAKKRLAEKK